MKNFILFCFFLTVSFSVFASGGISSYTVTNTNDGGPGSLRDAIYTANSNSATPSSPFIIYATGVSDTIKLIAPLPSLDNHITINGPTSGPALVISGENMNRVFLANGNFYITINKIHIVKGNLNPVGYGGGIKLSSGGGELILNNCVIKDNSAERGGGIYSQCKLTLNNCVFDNNIAYDNGGGLKCEDDTLSIFSCNFINNKTSSQGGAIFYAPVNAGKLTVNSTTFINDTCYNYSGGAIQIGSELFYALNCSINNSSFNGNYASYSGGAISAYGIYASPIIVVKNTPFNNNNSDYSGGAIYNEASIMNFSKCDFSFNSAVNGGVFYNSDTLSVDSCTIHNNSAISGGKGGVLYNYYLNSPPYITGNSIFSNCTINNNHADDDGGAVYNEGNNYSNFSQVKIDNSTINNNTSDAGGGGFYNIYGGILIMNNSTISNNSSEEEGGGIYSGIASPSQLYLTNCTIFGNTSSQQGGGIDIHSNDQTDINNCIIAGNMAPIGSDVNGIINSSYGHNIIGNPSGGSFIGNFMNNIVGVSANKIINTTLANNGGATQTHALINCSPAINSGANVSIVSPHDQRGILRQGNPDIGAFEENTSLLPAPSPPVIAIPTAVNCFGKPIAPLSASGSGIKWYSDYMATTNIGSGASLSVGTFNKDSVFYATQTISGCESVPSAAKVTVNANPNFAILPTTRSICSGSSINLMSNTGGSTPTDLNFNGTDGYVQMPTLDLSNGYAMTMEAWVKPTELNVQYSYQIISQDYYGSMDWGLYFSHYGTKLSFDLTTGINEDPLLEIPIVDTNYINKWHHIAAVYNGSNMLLYVDGNLMGSIPASDHVAYGGTRLSIGAGYNASDHFFKGEMDEVRIWNTVRTPSQIRYGMYATIPGNTGGLVSYYRFDEGSDLTTNDATVNAHNGTLMNGVSWITNPAPAAPIYSSYSWSPLTALNSTNGYSSVTASPTVSTTYTVTAFSSQGCAQSQVVTVQVANTMSITAQPSNTNACDNTNPIIGIKTSGTVVNYQWQLSTDIGNTFSDINNGGTYNNANGDSLMITSAIQDMSTYQYRCILTGCTSSATTNAVTLSVYPYPTLEVSNDTMACIGNSLSLQASGSSNYLWSPSSFLNTNTGALVLVNLPSASIVYAVMTTNGVCSVTDSIHVLVPILTVDAGTDAVICPGTSIQLNGSTSAQGPNEYYMWSPTNGLNGSSPYPLNVIAAPAVTTKYFLQASRDYTNGKSGWLTCSNVDSVTITVDTNHISTITPAVTICLGNPTNLAATGAIVYNWSPSTGLSTITGAVVSANPPVTTTYTVTGCNNKKSVIVTVNSIPTVTVSSSSTICSGQSIPLTAGGANIYTWSPSAGLSSLTGSSVTANPPSTITYTVIGKDVNGCSNAKTVAVNVNITPAVNLSSNVSICLGTSDTLSATGAFSYSWAPSNGLSSDVVANPLASPTSTTNYTVTGYNANGCSDVQTIIVKINPLPVVTASIDVSICRGTNASLNAGGAVSYSWMPSSYLDMTNNAAVNASPTTTINYIVTGTDVNGCSDNDSVVVNVIPAEINGNVVYSAGAVAGNSKTFAKLFKYVVNKQMEQTDSVGLDANGKYIFNNISVLDSFIVFVSADTSVYHNTVTTYYAGAFEWINASTIKPSCPSTSANITLVETQVSVSGGTVSGKIVEGQGFGKTEAAGDGIGGVEVGLKKKPGGQLSVVTTTNSNGDFSLNNVPLGSEYTLYVDIPGLPVVSTYTIDFTSSTSVVSNINFEADSDKIETTSSSFIKHLNNNFTRFSIYPNPAKQSATISFQLTENNNVAITLNDIVGREVKSINSQGMNAGKHFISINLSDINPGIYFIKLKLDKATYTEKLLRIE